MCDRFIDLTCTVHARMYLLKSWIEEDLFSCVLHHTTINKLGKKCVNFFHKHINTNKINLSLEWIILYVLH